MKGTKSFYIQAKGEGDNKYLFWKIYTLDSNVYVRMKIEDREPEAYIAG